MRSFLGYNKVNSTAHVREEGHLLTSKLGLVFETRELFPKSCGKLPKEVTSLLTELKDAEKSSEAMTDPEKFLKTRVESLVAVLEKHREERRSSVDIVWDLAFLKRVVEAGKAGETTGRYWSSSGSLDVWIQEEELFVKEGEDYKKRKTPAALTPRFAEEQPAAEKK